MNIKQEQEILKWHLDTFPDATIKQVTDKLVEELGELSDAITFETNDRIAEETSDVCIVCIRLANQNNITISSVFTTHEPQTLIGAWVRLEDAIKRNKGLLYAIQMFYSSAYKWCQDNGYDLFKAIDDKMAINKRRNWEDR